MSLYKDSLVGFAFVDNTDIVEEYLTKTEINIEDSYIIMQKYINRWEGGIKSAGGATIPDKSFIYPIYFMWYEQGDYSFEKPDGHNM